MLHDSSMTLEQMETANEEGRLERFKQESYWRLQDRWLETRTINCLLNEGIYSVEELIQKTKEELLKMPNSGRKTVQNIEGFLRIKGLKLKPPPKRPSAYPWYKFCH